MKKYLKITSLLLAGLLAVSFAGCSQQKAADGDMPSASTSPAAQSPLTESATPESATPEPATPEPQKPTWTVVNDIEVTHKTNYEGFLNEQTGITVGYAGEIHYTTDGGKTWPRGENKSMCRYALEIVNENLAICGGNGHEVRVTKDGGKTWTELAKFNGTGMHYHISFADENNGWIATANKFAATSDGGMTWNELQLPEGEKKIQALFLRTATDGYVLTPNGSLYTTTDGGQTFSKQDLNFNQFGFIDLKQQVGYLNPDTCAMAEINFSDANNGMIALIGVVPGAGYQCWVLETTDGGASWKNEELKPAEDFKPSSLFLTRDGKYLTLSATNKRLLVLRKEAP